MGTLEQGLRVPVEATISGFTSAMKKVQTTGIAASTTVTKGFASTTGAIDKSAASIGKWTGIVGLAAGAVGALVAPALKAQDAMMRLSVATGLTGQSAAKATTAAKKLAEAIGITTWKAADKLTNATLTMGQTIEGASAAMKAATSISGTGVTTTEQAFNSLSNTARALGVDLETTADQLGETIQGGAIRAGDQFATFAGAIEALGRPLLTTGASLESVSSALSEMRRNGLTTGEAVQSLGALMSSTIRPTEEQADAWESLFQASGQNLKAFTSGTNILSTLDTLRNKMGENREAVVELLGGNEDLAAVFERMSSSSFSQSLSGMRTAMEGAAELGERVKSPWEELIEALTVGIPNALSEFRVGAELIVAAVTKIPKALEAFADRIEEGKAKFQELEEKGKETYDNIKKKWSLSGIFTSIIGSLAQGYAHAITGFATGGEVPGTGLGDKVPALLEPGEFVIRRSVAQQMMPQLEALNMQRFATGGQVLGKLSSRIDRAETRARKELGPLIRTVGDPKLLWMTSLANASLAGTPLLEILRVGRPQISTTVGAAGLEAAQRRASTLANSSFRRSVAMLETFVSEKGLTTFKHGGQVMHRPVNVQRFASGGSVQSSGGGGGPIPQGNTSSKTLNLSGGMHFNMQGGELTQRSIIDTVMPRVEREARGGRSRIARSRR